MQNLAGKVFLSLYQNASLVFYSQKNNRPAKKNPDVCWILHHISYFFFFFQLFSTKNVE